MQPTPLLIAPSSGEMPSAPTLPSASTSEVCTAVESSPSTPRDKAGRKRGQAIAGRERVPVKPDEESKTYKVAMAIIAMRAQGAKPKQISETLGYSEDTLRQYLSRAYKKGWINLHSFGETEDQLEFVIKHKIVRNINDFLDERDKDVTLEAAKGLGLFKSHAVVKGEGQMGLGVALSVKVEMPPTPAGQAITIRPGTMGGVNAADVPLDAELVETEER